jgi:hypothetical protein
VVKPLLVEEDTIGTAPLTVTAPVVPETEPLDLWLEERSPGSTPMSPIDCSHCCSCGCTTTTDGSCLGCAALIEQR